MTKLNKSKRDERKLKLGAVTIENDSWICIFGCYHKINDPQCECDCHNKFKLVRKSPYEIRLRHHELGAINMKGVKSY